MISKTWIKKNAGHWFWLNSWNTWEKNLSCCFIKIVARSNLNRNFSSQKVFCFCHRYYNLVVGLFSLCLYRGQFQRLITCNGTIERGISSINKGLNLKVMFWYSEFKCQFLPTDPTFLGHAILLSLVNQTYHFNDIILILKKNTYFLFNNIVALTPSRLAEGLGWSLICSQA